MGASVHAVPKLHHRGYEGAPPEHVAQLKAMRWAELVAYCDLVRSGVPDALLALIRSDLAA
jgi:hypothetical protein